MFKKITSDRDPRDTVLSEIKKEFRPWFTKAGMGLKKTAERYPKFLFCMMVINMCLSIILCFTVMRHKEVPKKQVAAPVVNPVSGGLDRIMQAGAALKATIRLKKQIDSITRQHTLSKADSATLLKDLDSLQHIRNHINL